MTSISSSWSTIINNWRSTSHQPIKRCINSTWLLIPRIQKNFRNPPSRRAIMQFGSWATWFSSASCPLYFHSITIFGWLTYGTSIKQHFLSFYGNKSGNKSLNTEGFPKFSQIYTSASVCVFFHAATADHRVNSVGLMGKTHIDRPQHKILLIPPYSLIYGSKLKGRDRSLTYSKRLNEWCPELTVLLTWRSR